MKAQNKQKWMFAIGMLFVAVLLIIVYRKYADDNGNVSTQTDMTDTKYSFAMGTSVSVTLYGAKSSLYDELEQTVKTLDTQIISWRSEESSLAKLNHEYVAGETYSIDNELYTALRQTYNICEDSEGALDITLRPLALVWNIEEEQDDETFTVPSKEQIDSALSKTGYENISFYDDTRTIMLSKSDMILDLGAVGKGFALDVLEQKLKQNDVPGAVISVGGSVLVYGSKEDGTDFRIGIRDPKGTQGDMIGYLTIPSGSKLCISTSGDYEKYKEKNGIRYHHILSRVTGYPADAGISGVTVVCESGLYSDALSTACFVLGKEKSMVLLEKYNAEAIFIDKDNHIFVTDGLKSMFLEQAQ